MATINLTPREMEVARLVFAQFKPFENLSIGAEDWRSIARDANITDGVIERNAKFAWTNFVSKMSGAKGKGATNGQKRSKSSEGGNDTNNNEEGTPAKKKATKAPGRGRAGKGKNSPVKKEVDEDDMAQDEDAADVEGGAEAE